KVLPSYASKDAKSLERFRREARAAAKLHHSNIVPVFDVGEAEGLPFYAMQFIPGESLDQVLDELRRMRSGNAAALVSRDDDGRTSLEAGTALQKRPAPRDVTATIAGALVSGRFETPAEDDLPALEEHATQPARVELTVEASATVTESTVVIRADDATQPMLNSRRTASSTSSSPSGRLLGHAPLSLSERQPQQHYYQSVAR